MNAHLTQIAESCLRGAEDDSKTFPEIVATLFEAGFEGYLIDFRRATATYYGADGDGVALPTHRAATPIADRFDTTTIQAAILEAQRLVPGYTYAGFCRKVMTAGCAGYLVSFPGRRVVYFGRTAEVHTVHFPQ